jgi:C-terminal processing protease CtpA/Prc
MSHGDSDDERLASDQQYAATGRQIMDELEGRGVRRWVVNLRRNTGGNMYPMLLAVGRLIGEGECAGFVYPTHRDSVKHDRGVILLENTPLLRLDHPSPRRETVPVVAILTSPHTTSSGELVALAFRGLPRTRSFGEATAGVPTANEFFDLPDGARLLLTVALGSDRTGQVYDSPLIPDHPVSIDWAALERDDDPVVRAAHIWIEEQQ